MRTIILLLLLFTTAFGQEVRKALPVEGQTSTWDARAKFLAGIPLPPGVPLAKIQERPDYQAHSVEFGKMWDRYRANYFSQMREWSASELAPRIAMQSPVFYFFGGPDIISPLALFPEAPHYILGGLEPVGEIPDPAALSPPALQGALQNLRLSTNEILSFGFFITKDMKAELAAGEFKGVTPILLVFLAMGGCEVVDVAYFGVQKDGHPGEYVSQPRDVKGELPGVTVTFRQTPTAELQKLHYVQANVADGALMEGKGILRWAENFGPGNVYFKAASYLLHESSFSKIRRFLLERANAVLQDDSGIPFSYFQNGEWRVWFFGGYSGTLDIFKQYHQPVLADAFRVTGVPLAFGTGYKWRVGESNLLLAVKQPPPKAEAVTPSY